VEVAVANTVFTTFAEVQSALQNFVTVNGYPVAQAPHHNMWEQGTTEDEQYTYFVTKNAVGNFKILDVGNGDGSNIIKALRGVAPFDGSRFPRMPVGGPPWLDDDTINAISAWITAGAKQ
jgi:hypothetical protein